MNKLIIGNKNYSSWSLRPWLLMKQFNIEFEEVKIPLYAENSKEQILAYSPSGFVPALEHDDVTVWDSLAICEFLNDRYPEKAFWPGNLEDRALARSISAEMHSSFFALRNLLPMNCRKSMGFTRFTAELTSDINRICEIWQKCLERKSQPGDFLFGDFCIADAMFAPVVIRFKSYGISVGEQERHYMQAILDLPSLQDWIEEGVAEAEVISANEI